MADVLIRGMEMPTGAEELRLIIRSNGQVIISKQTYWEETEAIEVSDHGRLIDADRLGFAMMDAANADQALTMVDDAPAVIPASTEEET